MVVSWWGCDRGAWGESLLIAYELKARLIEQLSGGDVQRPGDTQDVRQGDIAFAPLHRTDIGAMDADLGRKSFLRNTGGPSPFSDHGTQFPLCVINTSSHISNCSHR